MGESIGRAAWRNRLELLNKIRRAKSMKDQGYSNLEIAKVMGLDETSVRSLLKPEKMVEEKDELKLVALSSAERMELPKDCKKAARISFLESEHCWLVEVITDEAYISTTSLGFEEAAEEAAKFLKV